MPTLAEVEQALLRALLKHGGVIKEFGAGQEIVDEIANEFELDELQRSAFLETIYRKENRAKKSLLWHRLLFRAADALARNNLVTRPTQTLQLTKKREWLLTEKGFDDALKLCKIPIARKEFLPTKSFGVNPVWWTPLKDSAHGCFSLVYVQSPQGIYNRGRCGAVPGCNTFRHTRRSLGGLGPGWRSRRVPRPGPHIPVYTSH